MSTRTGPIQSGAHEIGFRIGDDVSHPAFGEGVIIEITGQGDRAEWRGVRRGVRGGSQQLALCEILRGLTSVSDNLIPLKPQR